MSAKKKQKPRIHDPKKANKFFEARIAFTTGPAELKSLIDSGTAPNIFDVRTSEEFAKGHIPSAISLPEEQWKSAKGLSKSKLNVFYCYSQTCHLAPRAAYFFSAKGYPVMELDGGFDTWKEYGYEIATEPSSQLPGETQAA